MVQRTAGWMDGGTTHPHLERNAYRDGAAMSTSTNTSVLGWTFLSPGGEAERQHQQGTLSYDSLLRTRKGPAVLPPRDFAVSWRGMVWARARPLCKLESDHFRRPVVPVAIVTESCRGPDCLAAWPSVDDVRSVLRPITDNFQLPSASSSAQSMTSAGCRVQLWQTKVPLAWNLRRCYWCLTGKGSVGASPSPEFNKASILAGGAHPSRYGCAATTRCRHHPSPLELRSPLAAT